MGGDGDIVQRIVQFVGNTGGKRSDCPHLVGLNENGLTSLQLLDHVIERDGQVGELVPETAPGSNRAEISRGDPFGVHGEPSDGAQNPAAKEVRIQNEKEQQEDKRVHMDMAGSQDGLGKWLLFLLQQVICKGDHFLAVPPQLHFDLFFSQQVGRVGSLGLLEVYEPLEQNLVPFEVGQDDRLAVFSKDLSELFSIDVKDLLGLIDIFQGIVQVRAVEEEVLFEAAGLLDLQHVLVGDLQEMEFLFDLVHGEHDGGGNANHEQEDEKETEVNMKPKAVAASP